MCRTGRKSLPIFLFFAILIGFRIPGRAQAAAFDLTGPKVDLHVEREGKTLPISEVPSLKPGDRLWIHPDLPESQSVHYLMIVAFLRGSTNPPPESWFTRGETWNKSVHEEGLFITVPAEAEEALVFLAPDTGGGFSTLRKAVSGKPGAFVRASQDLWQASLDRARLEKYLAAVKDLPNNDPVEFKQHTQLLARSLNIKVDSQCFDKPTAQQVPCLTQGTDQLVLDDAHTESMVTAITSGASGDLMNQISASPSARFGYYSPYVGAIVDVARILGTTHTAQYQYIPALALPKQDTLNLRLNNPPSFRNPKSVIVIGLPPINNAPPPPLHQVDLKEVACLSDPHLVLSADGAPLLFATNLAHDLTLHLQNSDGESVDLPATADPAKGGIVFQNDELKPASYDEEFTATLRGQWGFQNFEGPHFALRSPRPAKLVVASKDASALIVGRDDTLHLHVDDAACVKDVVVHDQKDNKLAATWKKSKADELELHVPLKDENAGLLQVEVAKYGLRESDAIALHTYAEAARLDSFELHAGDIDGVLKGTRLDQVASVEMYGVKFLPKGLTRANQVDELKMVAAPGSTLDLKAGDKISAHAELNDGRTLEVSTNVIAPRPQVTLVNKTVQSGDDAAPTAFHFANPDDLPQDARLSFVLKSQSPSNFAPDEKIEVATSDDAFRVVLSARDGNLMLQDSKTIVAVLDPMKHLGPSAFGTLKFRPVSADGVQGDWQPLVSLVRIPQLKGIRCVTAVDKPQCALVGEKLYLIDSVSTDEKFTTSVEVPDGFLADALPIPKPKNKTLYVKLRDNPEDVNTVALPTLTP
ncbi:MAG TPA: hypothetical protein VGL89_11900 [Candidatus Koribacter sp.]